MWMQQMGAGRRIHHPRETVHIRALFVHDVSVVTVKRSVVAQKRPRVWRDPRFIVGVLLIVASVLACTLLVAQARGGTRHYQVTREVAVGEILDGTNTRAAEVRTASDAYLPWGDLVEGAVATRSMATGELLARGAVADRSDAGYRRLMVTVSSGLPDSAQPGTAMELWFVPGAHAGGERMPARLVAPEVVLVRISEATGGLVSQGATRIEVRLPVSDLAEVLEATGGDGVLTAVPVGG